MPLHLTKVAFGCDSIEYLQERLALKAAHLPAFLTTRYLPKRHAEIVSEGIGGSSLFWILKHQLVARSPILGFAEAEGGRTAILLDPALVQVVPQAKRAHQGWRYLEGADAPVDLGSGDMASLSPELAGKLAELGF